MAKQSLPKNIDEYIQQFEPNVRAILEHSRDDPYCRSRSKRSYQLPNARIQAA